MEATSQPGERPAISNPHPLQTLELTLPEGLVGYPEWKHFTLEESRDGAPVGLLQSHEAEVFFLVTRPEWIYPSYRFEVPAHVRDLLGLSEGEEPLALCILSVRHDPLTITANFLGPLVYNPLTGLAYQMVLDGSYYSPRHPVVLPQGATAPGEGSSTC